MSSEISQLSSMGHDTLGGSRTNLMMPSLEVMLWSSDLNPQQREFQMALVIGHLRNKWAEDPAFVDKGCSWSHLEGLCIVGFLW